MAQIGLSTVQRASWNPREPFITAFLNSPTNEELFDNYFSWENLIDINSRPGKNERWLVRTLSGIEKRVDIRVGKKGRCAIPNWANTLADDAGSEILYPPEMLPGKYSMANQEKCSGQESKDEILIYHDAFTQDYFLNAMLRYLLGKSLRKGAEKGILKYQEHLIDKEILPLINGTADRFDKKPRGIIVLDDGTTRQMTTGDLLGRGSEIDLGAVEIFRLLNEINSTLKDLNRIGLFVHGSLTKERVYFDYSLSDSEKKDREPGKYLLSDFSTSSLQVTIRDAEGEIEDYALLPTLPDLESVGDCPFIQIDYENHYYIFKNEDQYLLALKRGYIGRLAFSERRIFSTIDIYILIISLLFDSSIRSRFFTVPRGTRYWQKLWINEEYSQQVKEELENTTCKSCPILINEESSPDGYPTRLAEILAFLKNRPLKTTHLLPFDSLIEI
jgi:hypothetical protein